MACVVRGCGEQTHKKYLMCNKHWNTLPQSLREDVRQGTEKGRHSLRAVPTREWLSAAVKHVGEIRNLIVKVDADTRVRRKFVNTPSESS